MSTGEVVITIASVILTWLFWGTWYYSTRAMWPTREAPPGRLMLWLAPLLAAVLILAVLKLYASHDVVDDIRYITLYLALGMAWVGAATYAFRACGIHVRDDAIERRNPAVPPAVAGAIIGVAAAYAGGNIGDGPGWWVVVASAFVATTALLVVWQLLDLFTGVAESITVERDVSAGWRLGGFLLASGFVLGRSVAGDWVSMRATIVEAAVTGWPVLALLALAVMFERQLRVRAGAPTPQPSVHGVLPALAMVALAVSWISWLGLPQ